MGLVKGSGLRGRNTVDLLAVDAMMECFEHGLLSFADFCCHNFGTLLTHAATKIAGLLS